MKSGILIQYLKTPKLDGAPSCRERVAAPMRFFRFLPHKGAKFPEKGTRNSECSGYGRSLTDCLTDCLFVTLCAPSMAPETKFVPYVSDPD